MTRRGGRAGLLARLRTARGRLSGLRMVRLGRDVLGVLDRAGGGLLTAGLAYRILVTLLPGLALVVGAIGVLIDDPGRREEIALRLVDAFPPLEPIIRDALVALARGGTTLSIVALLGLAWASSSLYAALDDALARIFVGAPRRHPVRRRLIGVLAVTGLIALVVVLAVGSTLANALLGTVGDGRAATLVGSGEAAAGSLAVLGAPIGLAIMVYATMPRRRIRWRLATLAGIVAGGLIGLLTAIFQVIAPRLASGSLALFGSFVTIFVALVWLGWVAQVLLLGAAWLQVASRGRPAGGPPRRTPSGQGPGDRPANE